MSSMKTESTTQKLTPEATLDQIISVNSNAPHLLQSIGLDPNSHANKTLRQICSEKQWNEVELLKWIKKNHSAEQVQKNADSFKKKNRDIGTSVTEICNFLTTETLPVIENLSSDVRREYERVSQVHGMQYAWLNEAKWHVNELLNTLQYFIKFETETFYPLVTEFQERGERILDGSVQNLKKSIDVVKQDHQIIEERMERIKKISRDFHYDESACSTLRILCTRLETLYRTIDKHVKIEKTKLLSEIENKLTSG